MKRTLIYLVAVFMIVACGGGGGGGGKDNDPGTAPEIMDMFLYLANDPDQVPIGRAEVGAKINMFFCYCDPDLDVNLGQSSLWFPPDAPDPFEVDEGVIEQTEECECWITGTWTPTPPVGFYAVRLDLRDAQGNWAVPGVEVIQITQTNTNFDYLTEEAPQKRWWKEGK